MTTIQILKRRTMQSRFTVRNVLRPGCSHTSHHVCVYYIPVRQVAQPYNTIDNATLWQHGHGEHDGFAGQVATAILNTFLHDLFPLAAERVALETRTSRSVPA